MTTITTRTAKGSPLTIAEVDANFTNLNTDKIETNTKDVSDGVAGLTALKLNLKNAANTFTNFLTNATTAARTWSFPDKDGTVAMIGDVLPNVTNVFSSTAPNDVANAAGIMAVASTTHAHLILAPKGFGGISRKIPTSATGIGSVNFSVDIGEIGMYGFACGNGRASGRYSFAAGFSKSQGEYAAAFGISNCLGKYGVSFGQSTTLGQSTASFGSATATAPFSASFGGALGNTITRNKVSTSAGDFPMQSGITPLQVYVDEFGGAQLSANGITDLGAYDATKTYCLPLFTISAFEIQIAAKEFGTGSCGFWVASGVLEVDGIGVATIHGLVITLKYLTPGFALTAPTIVADPLFPGMSINVTAAPAGTYVSWGATIISTELTFS